jgi:hypothetical protein
MDSTGLPDERGARSIAGHALGGVRGERRGRSTRSNTVRPGPVVNRAVADVETPTVVHERADHLQAEYFLRLLVQNRQQVDRRLGKYQKAIAAAQAAGDTEGARSLRRMACAEERDGHTLDRLVENLRRRFPGRAPGEVRQPRAPARLVAR